MAMSPVLPLLSLLLFFTSHVCGEAVPPDITLLPFQDLVHLARYEGTDLSRQDKSFTALEFPSLQEEVVLGQPNIYQYFPANHEIDNEQEHGPDLDHEDDTNRGTRRGRLEQSRQSKQRSSYLTNKNSVSPSRNRQTDNRQQIQLSRQQGVDRQKGQIGRRQQNRQRSKPSPRQQLQSANGQQPQLLNGQQSKLSSGQEQQSFIGQQPQFFSEQQPQSFNGPQPQSFSGQQTQSFSGQQQQLFNQQQPQSFSGQQPQSFSGQLPQSFRGQESQSFSGQQPQSFNGQQIQSFSGQQPQLLNRQQPQFFSRQQPQSLSGQQPQSFSGQQPQFFSGQQPQSLSGQQPQLSNRKESLSNSKQRAIFNNRQDPQVTNRQDPQFTGGQQEDKRQQQQPELSFAQQSKFWADRSKNPDRSTDFTKRVQVGNVGIFRRNEGQQSVRNELDIDLQKDLDVQIRNNAARRKPVQNRRTLNKARKATDRKTVKIPVFLPSLNDLSFVNTLFNPNRARKPAPAQTRSEPKPIIEEIAESKEKCVDKIVDVEELEYDEVEECDHSYDEKCHTSYVTEYTTQQQEECGETFTKQCEITYEHRATNQTVTVCMNPLVKDCNLPGPEVCRTEYITECFTLPNPGIVVDDRPQCDTVYDEKCQTVQQGYTEKEVCKSWPKQVCTIIQQVKKKFDPQTKCEKVPQEICGPSGCQFVAGPEQCYDKQKTFVTDLPLESCFLQPSKSCEQVSKLVPLLNPVEECVDVPKEICRKVKGNPRTVVKQVTKTWCYSPSEESGLV